MPKVIRTRLPELMAKYQQRTGSRLSQRELSKYTGITQSTISHHINNQVKMYDIRVLERFIRFFDLEDIGDLLQIVEEENSNGNRRRIFKRGRK